MSNGKTSTVIGIALMISLVFQFGCGSTKPSRFYVLTPASNPEGEVVQSGGYSDISVGIGILKFPDHLLRPQIAIQTGSNKLDYAEYDRWAEPLNDNFARVMAENLSKIIPSDSVYIYPWKSTTKVQYQLNFEVMQFSQGADGSVTLIVFWSIFDNSTAEQLLRKKTTLSQPGPSSDPVNYGSVVQVMSRLVEDLSRQVVSTLKAIESGVGPR
jgi:uncharacterized lipoprotein YmbA